MRMRTFAAAVTLAALGFATFAPAQQPGEPPKAQEQDGPKVKLRARVARLRAEVELMQIEHEVDVAVMKDMINGLKFSDMSRNVEGMAGPAFEELRKKFGGGAGIAPALPAVAGINLPQLGQDDARKEAAVTEETVKVLRKVYESSKGDFIEKTAALNEKKLELAELERRLGVAP